MALTRFERVFLAVLALAAALALSILALAGWRTHRHNAALRPQLETVYRLTPTDTFVRDPAADLAREGPPVNINAATRDELQTALGIGKALAQHIVELRAASNGRLTSISQLAALKGLSQKRLAALERRVVFGEPSGPVVAAVAGQKQGSGTPGLTPSGETARRAKLNVNAALAADLAALPHVGPDLARRIIALRDQRGGSFRSLDELLVVPGLSEKSLARLSEHLEAR